MNTKLLEHLINMYKNNLGAGIIAAEIEQALLIYFNNDTKKLNEILEQIEY